MLGSRWIVASALCLAVASIVGPASTFSARVLSVAPPTKGQVTFPYAAPDNAGNNWRIYGNGMFQQQSNQPIYSQGGTLQINGSGVNNSNVGQLDEKTGELILENLPAPGGLTVTRRIKVDREQGYVRMIDIFKNTQAQDVNTQVMVQDVFNYGIQAANSVADPRMKGRNYAWVGTSQLQGRAIAVIFGGRGSKAPYEIIYQQGNNVVQGQYPLSVPAGKEIALMHIHNTFASSDLANKWLASVRESKMLADVPAATRQLIVNFKSGISLVGNAEVLRGEKDSDVIELRGTEQRAGDILRGAIKIDKYNLKTFYGPVELPADRVIGLINIGDVIPKTLLVTRDGEIFGGDLEQTTVGITLSGGQVSQIPLRQIHRLGYRKAAGESEEWSFDKGVIFMRTGERMAVQPPAGGIEVVTRYGPISIKPELISTINFGGEDQASAAHVITLIDGSHFSGLVKAESFQLKLGDGQQNVSFPASSISRLQFVAKAEEPAEDEPRITLANDDVLLGVFGGPVTLDTAFGAVTLAGSEIRSISRTRGTLGDAQVQTAGGTTISGQIRETDLNCILACGLQIGAPVPLLEEYSNPRAKLAGAATQPATQPVTQPASQSARPPVESSAEKAALWLRIQELKGETGLFMSPLPQRTVETDAGVISINPN